MKLKIESRRSWILAALTIVALLALSYNAGFGAGEATCGGPAAAAARSTPSSAANPMGPVQTTTPATTTVPPSTPPPSSSTTTSPTTTTNAAAATSPPPQRYVSIDPQTHPGMNWDVSSYSPANQALFAFAVIFGVLAVAWAALGVCLGISNADQEKITCFAVALALLALAVALCLVFLPSAPPAAPLAFNASAGDVPVAPFESAFAVFLFDHACLVRQGGPAAVREVDDWTTTAFDRELAIESQLGTQVGVVCLLMVTMLASVPIAAGKSGRALWAAWMAAVAAQLLVVYLSLALFGMSYAAVRRDYGGCMVALATGLRVLDAVAIFAGAFHPAVVAKLALVTMYNAVLVEGLRSADVLRAVEGHQTKALPFVLLNAWGEDSMTKKHGAHGSAHGYRAFRKLCTPASLWWGYGLVMSVLTGSAFFGLAFLPIGACSAVVVLALAWLLQRAQRRLETWAAEAKPKQLQLALVKQLQLALAPFGFDATYDHVLSAALGNDIDEGFTRVVNYAAYPSNLTAALARGVLAFALAPVVFNGTCAAFFVYAGGGGDSGGSAGGGSAAANAALLAAFYHGSFHWLADATFALPSLAFDLSQLSPASVKAALAAAFEALAFDSAHYLQAAKNMEALNFAVSLVRPLVSATTGFLSMVGCTRTRTIDLAILNTTGGAKAGSAYQSDGGGEFTQLKAATQAILDGHDDHIERTGKGVRVRKLTVKAAVANPMWRGR